MKKIVLCTCVLLPTISFAAYDTSNCEIIGHRIPSKTIEECAKIPEICKEEPNSNKCIMNTKTLEQCTQEIEVEKIQLAQNYFAYKCPKTPDLVAYQSQPMVTRAMYYVYNDGTEIDADALSLDTEYIYVFRMGAGLSGALGAYTPEFTDYVLGPADVDGFHLTKIK